MVKNTHKHTHKTHTPQTAGRLRRENAPVPRLGNGARLRSLPPKINLRTLDMEETDKGAKSRLRQSVSVWRFAVTGFMVGYGRQSTPMMSRCEAYEDDLIHG